MICIIDKDYGGGMSELSRIERFKKSIGELQKLYYSGTKGEIHICRKTAQEAEDMIEDYLKLGVVNNEVIGWKSGKLISENGKYIYKSKDGCYRNVFGRKICEVWLNNYLDCVNDERIEIVKDDDFGHIYNRMVELNPPINIGPVYIITIICFISGGKWPIYDRFAYKAAKALVDNKSPYIINSKETPDKKNIKKVEELYSEYLDLLNIIFGRYSITRKEDRALWVYGHAKEGYNRFIDK